MNKKRINGFLLGLIIAITILLISNVLHFFVISKVMNHVYNTSVTTSDYENQDMVVAILTSKAKQVSLISKSINLAKELIVVIAIYFLVRALGKKYYISIIQLQTTLITIFAIELIPLIYNNIVQGIGIGFVNILKIFIFLIFYFAFMYNYLVDKEEAEKILELKEKYNKEKKIKKKKSNKYSSIKGGNKSGDKAD